MEFILIVLIALIYIHSVIQPNVEISSKSADDVTRLSQAKIAAQKLSSAINELEANQSDGKKTITLLVPKNSSVRCDILGNKIFFSTTMSSIKSPPLCVDEPKDGTCDQGFGCIDRTCTGFFEIFSGANLACDLDGAGNPEILTGNDVELAKIAVTKTLTGISVSYVT